MDQDNNERIIYDDDDDYFDRSGCGAMVATIAVVALFCGVVGALILFT